MASFLVDDPSPKTDLKDEQDSALRDVILPYDLNWSAKPLKSRTHKEEKEIDGFKDVALHKETE